MLPRIGLLSDSHGRATTTRRAVEVLLEHGAKVLLHLGDVGSVEVIDALAVPRPPEPGVETPVEGEQVAAHLVFGNTDWDAEALARYARGLGVQVDHPVGRLPVEGGHLVFCHGHQPQVMAEAMRDRVKYLCHGHTHQVLDTRKGPTRIINPGALFRASAYTVAVLDTAADEVQFYPVAER